MDAVARRRNRDLGSHLRQHACRGHSDAAGRTRTGLVRYTSNAFANYTFNEGSWRGFSFGGGLAIVLLLGTLQVLRGVG